MRGRDRLAARVYALAHDALVARFPPYQELLDAVAAYVGKSIDGHVVLDIACGTGTLARRLAADGHRVMAGDRIQALVDVAVLRSDGPIYYLFRDPVTQPPEEKFDAVVSLHTYYWHPDPAAVLAACRASLRPGGHAVLVTYMPPAGWLERFRMVRRRDGWRAAFRALWFLLPTAAFEALRTTPRRYVAASEFVWHVRGAGFEVLEVQKLLLGTSVLVWARRED